MQFPHSLRLITRNDAETVPVHKRKFGKITVFYAALAATTALIAVENKIPNFSNLAKKMTITQKLVKLKIKLILVMIMINILLLKISKTKFSNKKLYC